MRITEKKKKAIAAAPVNIANLPSFREKINNSTEERCFLETTAVGRHTCFKHQERLKKPSFTFQLESKTIRTCRSGFFKELQTPAFNLRR